MTGKMIMVGKCYVVKVSGNLVRCRVDALSGRSAGTGTATRYYDAWDCTNMETGRRIKVKSAQRFRSLIDD